MSRDLRKKTAKILSTGLTRILSKKTQGNLLRRRLKLNYIPSDDMTFKIAETKEELELAFRLLHDSYVREGFMRPHRSGMRVTIYHALPTTTILVAKKGSEVIGTISLIRESVFGLPLQGSFDTGPFKDSGGRLVEVSSLAVHPKYRGHQGILFLLCKYALEYCVNYIFADYMLIAVNPRQARFYEDIMLFNPIQAKVVETYGFANGAPAVGEYMDLRHYHNKLLEVYWGAPAERSLYAFFTQARYPRHFKFPERSFFKAADPVMTAELLDYFLNVKTNVLGKITDNQMAALRAVYSQSPAHLEVLPQRKNSSKSKERRELCRFPVQCPGTIINMRTGKITQIHVNQVSCGGFMAVCDEAPLDYRHLGQVRLAVGANDTAELDVKLVWRHDSGIGGYRVLRSDLTWVKFISHLQLDLNKVKLRPVSLLEADKERHTG